MSSGRRHRRVLVLTIGLIALLAGMLPQVIEAGGPKEHDPGATASVDGGTTAAIDVTVKNTSSSGNITAQGVRIYIDSDLPLANIVSVAKKPATASGTLTGPSANAPYIQVLDANIRRNDTYTVTVNVKVPCVAQGTVYDWTTDVRQSNDFNGTNNQLPAINPDPTPARTTVASGCSLAFTAQPKSAAPTATITNVAFDPNAAKKVEVSVKSGGASPSVVTWATGTVSVATSPATSLSGTTIRSLTNGVATFNDLSIAAADTYRLVASMTGLANVSSDQFTIGNGVTLTCTAGDTNPCTTGNFPGPTTGTVGNVTVNDGDTLTGTLTAQFITNDIDCPGYTEFGDRLFFDVDTQQSVAGLTKTVVVTKPIPNGMPSGPGEEWRYQVCFQSRDHFKAIVFSGDPQVNFDNLLKALSGVDVTVDAPEVPVNQRVLGDKSAPEYRGLLPQCSLVNNVAPCLVGPPVFNGGLVTWTGKVPAADPVWK
jgi:hypothetical protein